MFLVDEVFKMCLSVCLYAFLSFNPFVAQLHSCVTSNVATLGSVQPSWSLAHNNRINFQLFTQLKSSKKCKKERD